MQDKYFPYTFDWHSLAALSVACDILQQEGVAQRVKRHRDVAEHCRRRLSEMGIELYLKDEGVSSPTVTAAYVPLKAERKDARGWESWEAFDQALRKRGVVVGGSYGDVKGKVFRIGHMGSQADLNLVNKALDILQDLLASTH